MRKKIDTTADTYLNAIDKGPDGDAPGVSRAGLGWVTLRAKFELFQADGGEDGVALVPFVRVSTHGTLTGQSGADPGLIVPFNVDLEHGFEIQGSTGVTYGHRDDGVRAADWETQASLEWHFSPRWAMYVEPEVDTGEGPPRWALEEGFTCSLTRRIQGDVGLNTGLGKNSGARFVYVGLGFSY